MLATLNPEDITHVVSSHGQKRKEGKGRWSVLIECQLVKDFFPKLCNHKVLPNCYRTINLLKSNANAKIGSNSVQIRTRLVQRSLDGIINQSSLEKKDLIEKISKKKKKDRTPVRSDSFRANKWLSLAGRITLIKTTLTAMAIEFRSTQFRIFLINFIITFDKD